MNEAFIIPRIARATARVAVAAPLGSLRWDGTEEVSGMMGGAGERGNGGRACGVSLWWDYWPPACLLLLLHLLGSSLCGKGVNS
jgi:hypothetical protein